MVGNNWYLIPNHPLDAAEPTASHGVPARPARLECLAVRQVRDMASLHRPVAISALRHEPHHMRSSESGPPCNREECEHRFSLTIHQSEPSAECPLVRSVRGNCGEITAKRLWEQGSTCRSSSPQTVITK